MPPPTPVEARGSVLRFGVSVSRVQGVGEEDAKPATTAVGTAFSTPPPPLFLLLLLLLPILQQLAHYQK